MKICSVEGCEKTSFARGWCCNHYAQFRTAGFKGCSIEGCDKPHRAKGYCVKHYYENRPTQCSIDGCERPTIAKGVCKMHWRQQQDPNRTCEVCGIGYQGSKRSRYCSIPCKVWAGRSPVRRAVEAGDPEAIIEAIRDTVVISDDGCWLWPLAKSPQGYGMIGQGGKGGMVHRHALAASIGRQLRKGEVVHHKCAVRACVNPEHLQLVTQRENMAEMFSRTSLERRIVELESALAEFAPSHPLLIS